MYEILLLTSLAALVAITWTVSSRYTKLSAIVFSCFSLLFAIKLWSVKVFYVSFIFGLFVLASAALTFLSAKLSHRTLRVFFSLLLVLAAATFWYFDILKHIPFRERHIVTFPGRWSFNGYHFWGIFGFIALVSLFVFPHVKRTMGIIITLFWIAVFMLEGHSSLSLGTRSVTKNMHFGIGTEARTSYGETKLYKAAKEGNLEEVKSLLAKGANIHAERTIVIGGVQTPIEAAIVNGHYEVFLFLAENGAELLQAGKYGMTPLHYAAADVQNADFRIINYLLEHEAEINVQDASGKTPLFYAVASRFDKETESYIYNPDLVRFLIEKGADVNAATKIETPLVKAAAACNLEAIKILIESGADPSFVAPQGGEALSTAKQMRRLYGMGHQPYQVAGIDPCDAVIEYLTRTLENNISEEKRVRIENPE